MHFCFNICFLQFPFRSFGKCAYTKHEKMNNESHSEFVIFILKNNSSSYFDKEKHTFIKNRFVKKCIYSSHLTFFALHHAADTLSLITTYNYTYTCLMDLRYIQDKQMKKLDIYQFITRMLCKHKGRVYRCTYGDPENVQ